MSEIETDAKSLRQRIRSLRSSDDVGNDLDVVGEVVKLSQLHSLLESHLHESELRLKFFSK